MADILVAHLGLYNPIDSDDDTNNIDNDNNQFQLVMNVIGGGISINILFLITLHYHNYLF